MATVPSFAARSTAPGRSLRTRLMLWASLGQGLLLLLLVALFYLEGRSLVRQQGMAQLSHLAEQTARSLGNSLSSAEVTAHMLEAPLGRWRFEPGQVKELMRSALESDPHIEAAVIIVDPGTVPGLEEGFACQVVQRDGRAQQTCGAAMGFHYADRPFYQKARRATAPWWSAPHEGWLANGRRFTSYNVPLRLPGTTQAIGVVRVDVGVDHLQDDLADVPGHEDLRMSLLTPGDEVLMTTAPWVAPGAKVAEVIAQRPDMAPLRAALTGEGSRIFSHASAGGRRVVTKAVPLQQPGWHLLLSVDQRAVLAGIDQVAWWAIGLGVLGMALWLLLVRVQARRLLQPMEMLTAAAGRFADGHFEQPLPHSRDDEVGQMTEAFEHARRSIRQQMETVAERAAQQVRDESELRIAQSIQQQMLSSLPSVEGGGFRLSSHGLLRPARQVGGDFHHVLVLPAGDGPEASPRLCFVIGDVSGKGVPAALFMARLLTLLEAAMRLHVRPDAVLAEAARSALERNEACMFATVLCGVVDVASGRFELASAGHDAPLLRQRSGAVVRVPVQAGPALGIEALARYPLSRGVLAPGEYLLACTDGVTEARSRNGHWFGHEGLQAVVAACPAPSRVTAEVIHALANDAGEPNTQDDLSLLVVARRRVWPPLLLQAPGSLRDLYVLLVRLEDGLGRMGVQRADILRAQLLVEELGGNVVRHGSAGRTPQLEVMVTQGDDGLHLLLVDDGPAFDATAVADPLGRCGVGNAPDDDSEGGLGLALVRSLADGLAYQYSEGRNHHSAELRSGPGNGLSPSDALLRGTPDGATVADD